MAHQRKHFRCSCKGKLFKAGKGVNKQVLREGMIAELGAVNQYEKLAAAAPNKDVKKVFASVIKEEKTHMGEFQTMLLKEDKEQARELFKAKKEVSGTIRYAAGIPQFHEGDYVKPRPGEYNFGVTGRVLVQMTRGTYIVKFSEGQIYEYGATRLERVRRRDDFRIRMA